MQQNIYQNEITYDKENDKIEIRTCYTRDQYKEYMKHIFFIYIFNIERCQKTRYSKKINSVWPCVCIVCWRYPLLFFRPIFYTKNISFLIA